MIKSLFSIILLLIILTACNGQKGKSKTTKETPIIIMNDNNFKNIIEKIRTSDIYENPKNWEARGLNPSDQHVVDILRKATNIFLDKLDEIHNSNESSDTKLKQISNLVDELPWDELDTEEKEFMADTLAPAIEAAGFNPWTIF
jgi:hypothetical protein